MRGVMVLWGLIFDDLRLAGGTALSIVVAALCAGAHQRTLAAFVLAIGVFLSLTLSVVHERHKKK